MVAESGKRQRGRGWFACHSGCSVTICLTNVICYEPFDSSNEMYSSGGTWLMMLCTNKGQEKRKKMNGSNLGCAKSEA